MVHQKIEGPLLRAMWQVAISARTQSAPGGQPEKAYMLLDALDVMFGILLTKSDRHANLAEAMRPLLDAGPEFRYIAERFRDECAEALRSPGSAEGSGSEP